MSARRFYVTTPIYYINDVPHLGTAYTTVAADVLRRYHQLRGEDTFFLTGTDEHGQKIERVAKERGISPKEFADTMAAPFQAAWKALGCDYDHFIRTTDPAHEALAAELWRRCAALKSGDNESDIYLGHYEGWYCVGCEAYYTEKELAPGNVCPTHKTPVEKVKEESYFFRLSKYQDALTKLYAEHPEFVRPEGRLNEVRSFVAGGLEDISISRTTFDWGVRVPGNPKHVMYVWFDALANYWTAVKSTEKVWFWPDMAEGLQSGTATLTQALLPPDSTVLHLVGKDILRFHAVYWPAFLLSAGLPLPSQIFAHGWLTFDGQKMSKSLRNTVKPVALADAFGADTVRYYLMSAIALGQDGDFSLRDLVQRYNSELGNALGNLLNRVLPQCAKHFENRVPAKPEASVGALERDLVGALARAAEVGANELSVVAPNRAVAAIWAFIGEVNAYIDKAAPWTAAKQGDRARLGAILATALEALEAIATLVWPILPAKAAAIREQLGLAPLAPAVGANLWPFAWPRSDEGRALGVAAPIFPRIDPDRERELVASLGLAGAPAAAPADAAAPPPAGSHDPKLGSHDPKVGSHDPNGAPSADAAPAEVAYDDFAKLDLRVGLVVAAEKVPKKDKLLSLKVDLGEAAPRGIVAGLALSFQPEQLVGKRVVVVANLAPRSFGKGLVSHGMILAAGPSETLALATVAGEAAPGTRVK